MQLAAAQMQCIPSTNIFITSTSTWSTIQPTTLNQTKYNSKRHGLKVAIEISANSTQQTTLLLSEQHPTLHTATVPLHIAVNSAAAILQHGEAVHVVVADLSASVEFTFIFELIHAIGLCSTNNSPAMEWIKAQYGSNVVNSATLALTNSSISWSQALFPFGPDIHETLRTTNGINFKDAAKETVAVQLTTLPTLDIIQSKADGFEGLGAVVWQCGLVLCHFFDTNVGGEGKKMIQNQNVYDLGCGTGLVGIVAALCGAKKVVLSDRELIVDLAKKNVQCNLKTSSAMDRIEYEIYEWQEETKQITNHSQSERIDLSHETITKIVMIEGAIKSLLPQYFPTKDPTVLWTNCVEHFMTYQELDGTFLELKQRANCTNNDFKECIKFYADMKQQLKSSQPRKQDHHDIVIVSDGLYDHHSFNGLLATIQKLIAINKSTKFLFGYKMRHPEREYTFFQHLEQEMGMTLKVYDQTFIYPEKLRGTGIFIVEAVVE